MPLLSIGAVGDLGRKEPRGPAPHEKVLLLVGIGGQPKVDYHTLFLPGRLLPNHDVLWLEVPVNYVLPSHLP